MIAFWVSVAIMVGLTGYWSASAWSANDQGTSVIVGATSVALLAMSVAAVYG